MFFLYTVYILLGLFVICFLLSPMSITQTAIFPVKITAGVRCYRLSFHIRQLRSSNPASMSNTQHTIPSVQRPHAEQLGLPVTTVSCWCVTICEVRCSETPKPRFWKAPGLAAHDCCRFLNSSSVEASGGTAATLPLTTSA